MIDNLAIANTRDSVEFAFFCLCVSGVKPKVIGLCTMYTLHVSNERLMLKAIAGNARSGRKKWYIAKVIGHDVYMMTALETGRQVLDECFRANKRQRAQSAASVQRVR